jgi:acetyl-CoA carboxylase carboxyltransferase component
MTLLAIAAHRPDNVEADIRVLGGEEVAYFRLAGGARRGAIGVDEGRTICALVDKAVAIGVPVVGVMATSGSDVTQGVASLHAWGGIAAALTRASGVVPVVLVVVGPCVAGPALLLGLADVVVMTEDAVATMGSPAAVREITGRSVSAVDLGGAAVHRTCSGVAALTADDEASALEAVVHVLCFLPSNNLAEPTIWPTDDPVERRCDVAAAAVPSASRASYDVRKVLCDVVDDGELLELWADHAANVVTAFATVDGRPVGVVANQPCVLAGTLDIAASSKAARFVQLCDAFNVSLLTFVDTPGFQPGKDLEWRGMIRHGAELVHAYAAATVPRVSVVLRKAYGGAYIVMDSKGLGGDHCIAWPNAEMAVMGAAGAVEVLHGRRGERGEGLSAEDRGALEAAYAARHCTPEVAAARGFVDEVVAPEATRPVVAAALRALRNKRDEHPRRKHSNSPL